MDLATSLILAQDGIGTGAVYALLATALVMVFAVTRIIFIPQGDLVTCGALTIACMQAGAVPMTVVLLLVLAAAAFLADACGARAEGRTRAGHLAAAARHLAWPCVLAACAWLVPLKDAGLLVQAGLTVAIVACLGPLLYRLVYQPVAGRSVLLLLILSVALHFVLLGLGLAMFGAEGMRSAPFVQGSIDVGAGSLSAQSAAVMIASIALLAALWFFFHRTLAGKAMMATAVNPVGARLMGIRVARAGRSAMLLASAIAAASGVLIGPTTTIYYDSGFLIGLKGFVAAIFGGLHSYAIAAAGAVFVGLLEVFASFAASAYTEVIVFTLVIPVLLWRSLAAPAGDAQEA